MLVTNPKYKRQLFNPSEDLEAIQEELAERTLDYTKLQLLVKSLVATNTQNTPRVTELWLVNANTQADIRKLTNGATIDLHTEPTRNLNIRAVTAIGSTPQNVGSVQFFLSGQMEKDQLQTSAPYAAFGDSGGQYLPFTFEVGSYELAALPFPGPNGTGEVGAGFYITFTVTDSRPVINDVYGCTNRDASNFNPNATIDDGSCLLSVPTGYVRNASHLIVPEYMNNGLLNPIFQKEVFTDYGLEPSTEQSRFVGGTSLKFRMLKDAVSASGSKVVRSEIKINNYDLLQKEYWIGFSFFIPEDWIDDDGYNVYDIIRQDLCWNDNEPNRKDPGRTSPRQWITKGGKLLFKINYASAPTNSVPEGYKIFPLGNLVKGRWIDCVENGRNSYQADGFMNVWMGTLDANGKPILKQYVKYTGPTNYNDLRINAYPKFGPYKRDWPYSIQRTLFIDQIRYGKATADIKDVMADPSMPISYLP